MDTIVNFEPKSPTFVTCTQGTEYIRTKSSYLPKNVLKIRRDDSVKIINTGDGNSVRVNTCTNYKIKRNV